MDVPELAAYTDDGVVVALVDARAVASVST